MSVVLCIALSALSLGQAEGPAPSRGIVAIVGNEAITQGELDQKIVLNLNRRGGRISLQDLKERKPALERAVLSQMVDDLLILQEAWRKGGKGAPKRRPEQEETEKKAGLEGRRSTRAQRCREYVGGGAIDKEIEDRIRHLQKSGVSLRNADDFYRFFRQATGLDKQQVRDYVCEELAIRKYLWEEVWRGIDTFVTPRESRYYYRTHLADFTTPVEVSFRQIFLEPDRINSFIARKKIEEGIHAGRSFEELAREFSQDQPDPALRGRVITKSFEELRSWKEPIPDKLRTLGVGEISEVMRTDAGYHYFQLVSRVEGRPKPYSEVQKEIEHRLVVARREQSYRHLIRGLRSQISIDVLLPGAGKTSRSGAEPAGAGAEAGGAGAEPSGAAAKPSGGAAESSGKGEAPARSTEKAGAPGKGS